MIARQAPSISYDVSATRLLVAEQLVELRQNASGPNFIAFRAQVQQVGHDLLLEHSIGREELRADIEVEDVLAVVERLDDVVRAGVRLAKRVVIVGTAGENGEQQNLRFRQLITQLGDDGLDAVGDLFRRIRARIVGADHDDGNLGRDALDIAVVEPPEHMLGAVAAESEIADPL